MPGILSAVFNCLVCFLLPLGALLYVLVHRRPLLRPFLCGLLTLAVFQLGLSRPLRQYLLGRVDYAAFRLSHPLPELALFLGIAGLLAVGGQLLVMRLFMKNHLTWAAGVAFGFAHELFSALLVGTQNLRLLVFNSAWLSMHSPLEVLPAGAERILAWVISIGMTLLVMQGLRRKQPLYWLGALGFYMAANALPMLLGRYSAAPGLGALALLAAAMAAYIVWFKKKEDAV